MIMLIYDHMIMLALQRAVSAVIICTQSLICNLLVAIAAVCPPVQHNHSNSHHVNKSTNCIEQKDRSATYIAMHDSA